VTLVTASADQRQSLGIQLLADLRTVFGDTDLMTTETVLQKLNALEDAPWNDLRGKSLDARGLSGRLRKYELSSKTIRLDTETTAKGYRREDLADLWTRYLPPPKDEKDAVGSPSDSAVTSVTPSQSPDTRDAVTDVTHKSLGQPAELPVLFGGTQICADCAEPYDQPGFTSRCRDRHLHDHDHH
jgi:hypothetical protein